MNTKTNQKNTTTFACDMSVMTHDERQQHLTTIRELFKAVQEVQELTNGYAFRLDYEEQMLLRAAAFVAREQQCCPFFHFKIEVKVNEDSFWLNLTGPQGVKPFIQMEIGESLADQVALKAGFHTIGK